MTIWFNKRRISTMALTLASLSGLILTPDAVSPAEASTVNTASSAGPLQSLEVSTWAQMPAVQRDSFTINAPPPPPPPPPVVIARIEVVAEAVAESERPEPARAAPLPDPGSAKSSAYEMVIARGWGENEFSCLVSLWDRESGWNAAAANSSSGAYGIPQALPGSKMASAGSDWATNPATQIAWGLGYISDRYDSPCGAWAHSEDRGWY